MWANLVLTTEWLDLHNISEGSYLIFGYSCLFSKSVPIAHSMQIYILRLDPVKAKSLGQLKQAKWSYPSFFLFSQIMQVHYLLFYS